MKNFFKKLWQKITVEIAALFVFLMIMAERFTLFCFRRDRLKHFFVGYFLYAVLQVFMFHWYAFLIVVIVALLKEHTYDGWFRKGTPEFWDWFFTVLPGFLLILMEFGLTVHGFKITF